MQAVLKKKETKQKQKTKQNKKITKKGLLQFCELNNVN